MNLYEYVSLAYLLYAVFIIRLYKRLIANLSYIDNLDYNSLPELYRPFARYDKRNWNMLEIYFGAVVLLPLRLIGVGLLLIPCYLTLVIGSLGIPIK